MCTRMLSSLYFVFDPRLICTHCMKHLVLSAPGPLVSLLLILVVLAPHGTVCRTEAFHFAYRGAALDSGHFLLIRLRSSARLEAFPCVA